MIKDLSRLAWAVFAVGSLLAITYFFPWKDINWGSVVMEPTRTLTVSGTAESKEKNQIAKFSAGVSSTKSNRDEAIKEVNTKVAAITQSVKEFGIEEEDIITQSMSVYQMQDSYYDQEKQVQSQRPGQWSVSNTIEVTLRKAERASTLADLLSKGGATNVWGPNFQLDKSQKGDDTLTEDAVADAKAKAEVMAKASGSYLGKVISISEGVTNGGGYYPLAMRDGMGGGGGGTPIESGTTSISKTVTVTWSLE